MKFETNDAEYYFIQLLFCKNRDLLRKDYRDIYDAMFTHYEKDYNAGIKANVDIQDINDRFMMRFKKTKK